MAHATASNYFRAYSRTFLIAAAILLIGGCQIMPKGDDDAILESLYQAAHTAEQTYDYETAIIQYQKLVQRDPKNISTLIALARNLRYSGAAQKSLRALETLGAKHKASPAFQLEMAKTKIAAGKTRGAIQILVAELETHPENWEIHATLGIAYDLVEDFKNAQTAYENARRLSDDTPSIINNMAISAALSGDIERAISLLQGAPRLVRHNPQIRQNLALFYGIKGDVKAAEALARMDLDEEATQSNLAIYSQLRKK